MYLKIEFYGQIETTEAFKDLVKALARLHRYDGDENPARQALVDANLEGEGFALREDMYNYHSDAIEEIVRVAVKHKIDLVSKLTSGGMDDVGTIQFVRDGFASITLPIIGDEVALTTTVLGKLKNKGIKTVDQLEGFLDYFKVQDLPKFTVADEVITDIFLPKRRT